MINKTRRIRKFSFIIFLFIIASPAFAQQRSNYSLLWKISGKGMSKPSYLFGTIHLKDKRVFNFSDSVMLSLQSCRSFALEVHPDTLMAKMFATLQNPDSLRNVDKLLGKKDYEKLAKRFKDKNGYEMGKTDPMLLESLMEPNNNKAGDKVSFVDAYLYGIARTLNKKIAGLEDAASQFDQYFGSKEALKERLLDLIDDDATQAIKDGTEEMIKTYSTGNLDEIYKYIVDHGSDQDSIIIARNKVMASSIIKYMADGTLFTAVGAAHLPGPDGVIALLKKEGYTVTCVAATFTGVADKYKIDYLKMDWPVYKDEGQGYAVNFPGTPIKFNISGVNTIMYPDLANEAYYGIYSVPRGLPGAPANRTQVIDKFLNNIKQSPKNTLLGRKDFIFNKMPCTEILVKSSGTYMRIRLILANNALYGFYAGSRVNQLDLPHINRYLNSFKVIPVIQKAPGSWITYTNPVGAFTVKLPNQPQIITREIPTKISGDSVSLVLNMLVSTDTVNSKSYLIRYNDYPPGIYLKDPSSIFETLEKEFAQKGKIISGPDKITVDGYDAREMGIIINGGFYSKLRIFSRGNRVYMLFKEVIQPDVKDESKDFFFDSFKLIPYTEPAYYTFRPDSGNYEVQMVSKPKLLPDSARDKAYGTYLKNTYTYFSTNPNSGGVFAFEHSTLSPYYRANNVDSLYKKLTRAVNTYQDSVLKVDTIMLSGVKGRDMLTQNKETGASKRTRILAKGDDIFIFTGHMDRTELFDKSTETVFNSLKINVAHAGNDLAASKAEKIINDLRAADTAIFFNARGALSYYQFEANELPYVYKGLQTAYSDDTAREDGTRALLINSLLKLHNDTTVNFLVKLYGGLKNKDELKAVILNALPNIDNKAGYDAYINLLTTNAPANAKNASDVFKPLLDSVEVAVPHFQQVLPFIKNNAYRPYILRLTRFISDRKNVDYDKLLKDNQQSIMEYAQSDIDNYIALRDSSSNPYSGPVYNYMRLLSRLKNVQETNKLTTGYLTKDPNGLYASDAIVSRIHNGLPNNPVLVNKYLDSLGTRYEIMEAYSDENLPAKVPLKYRQQAEYARLCMYQEIAESDNGAPDKINLLGSVEKAGSIYYAFKFSLTDSDTKAKYIGLTGPYKPGSTKLNFKRYYAYTEYEEVKTNWRPQATKLIKELVDAYKE